MKLVFPPDFIIGTSTSAYQIETAFQHDWLGVKSEDGYTFDSTTDHEKRIEEDCEIIAAVAPAYRMSLMWSKLQREPYGSLHPQTTREYHQLLSNLKSKNISVMLVLHHFCNPIWFYNEGGWARASNVTAWVDFARKIIDEYAEYIDLWNTFNEPNLYTTLGYALGKFPPYRSNMMTAGTVIKNLGKAHDIIYDYLKEKYPTKPVGISYNCAVFEGTNIMGKMTAQFADQWYMEYLSKFFEKSDFTGLSYYARIPFDPSPITFRYSPKKIKALGREHDDIWEYYPAGLGECIERFWNKYQKPIIITENGICTNDDEKRVRAIKDYLKILHEKIKQGISIKGYYHWSTWDNFEWTLGPTFKFGLYGCDPQTKERKAKPSADFYSKIAHSKTMNV
jgi:beta-glucosidase